MRISLEETLEKTNIMVIDGSMSTALEALGCDLNDSLWTAKILAGQPDLVRQVHLGYFRAGADCGITASYQATIPGLTARGYSRAGGRGLYRPLRGAVPGGPGELVGPGGPGQRTGQAAVPGGRGSLRGVPGRRV